MLDSYGIRNLLVECKGKDVRLYTGEPGAAARMVDELHKVKYFRTLCSSYDQLVKRMGMGFLMAVPDGVWKERE
jgi:hypothetical protein